MRYLSTGLSVLAVLLLLLPASATAQTTVEVGPRLGISLGDAADIGGDIFLGADARISSASLPVVINPAFDYYFVSTDGVSLFNVSLNALYEFTGSDQVFTPYAGGGLGIVRTSFDAGSFGTGSDTDIGLNLVGGAKFQTGSLQPFVQAKAKVGGDVSLFNIMGGLLFRF
ncbi:outer membrane beta-barrel protein [Salisaeta longa]|uniref:outer membrane beta-barrel protein n=1 Tax=Salisaeta longa TaxID=503170 RepID=UPI0003B31A26|nr:outer membrane beta-barrel protein [Salisaeta longa]